MEREHSHSHESDRKFTVRVATPEECKRVLSLEIPQEEVDRERDLITRQLQRDVRVPGFRKGKVPVEMIRKQYRDVIAGDAVRNLLPLIYEQALHQEHIHPLGEPSFENLKAEEGSGIQVDATVEVRPDVTVEGYKNLKVEAKKNDVTDEDVDRAIEGMRERLATFADTEREAASSDFMVIDYAPYLESGEIDEAARQPNHPVDLSSEQLIEEFRVGLVGLKKGESKDISVTYPEDFAEEALRGTSKRFQVTVKEVKEKLLPDLDDAFAARMGDEEIKTMDALRKRVHRGLVEEEEKRYRHEVEEKAIDALIVRNQFTVPDVMVQNYLTSVVEEDRRRRPEVPDEDKRVEEIKELFHEAAVRTIKKYFVLDAIGRQEEVTVTDEDVAERIEKLVEDSGREKAEIEKFFRNPEQRRRLESDLQDEKILEVLRGHIDIKTA